MRSFHHFLENSTNRTYLPQMKIPTTVVQSLPRVVQVQHLLFWSPPTCSPSQVVTYGRIVKTSWHQLVMQLEALSVIVQHTGWNPVESFVNTNRLRLHRVTAVLRFWCVHSLASKSTGSVSEVFQQQSMQPAPHYLLINHHHRHFCASTTFSTALCDPVTCYLNTVIQAVCLHFIMQHFGHNRFYFIFSNRQMIQQSRV